MVEPRLPELMTPERADRLARRWRLATHVLVAAGLGLLLGDAPMVVLMAWWLALTWCLAEYRGCRGWRDGYRAARREELERQAGDLR